MALLVLFAVVLVAGLWLRRKLPRPHRCRTRRPACCRPLGPPLWLLRIGALVAGVAAALSFAARPDVIQLWWIAVIVLGFAAVAVCFTDATRTSPVRSASGASEILLWLLAATVVVVTLISHRPDTDDAFYVDVAVATADIPQLALLSVDTMHGIPDLPLHLPVYRVDSYELMNGAHRVPDGHPGDLCLPLGVGGARRVCSCRSRTPGSFGS